MTLPPQLIRVKRKRDEESPVTFLQLEEAATKRHRGNDLGGWVYRRKAPESIHLASELEPPSQALRPVIQSTQAGDEQPQVQHCHVADSGGKPKLPQPLLSSPPANGPSTPDMGPASGIGSGNGEVRSGPVVEPRRYHYSRAASGLPSSVAGRSPLAGVPGISKRERYGPVFIEKRRSVARLPRTKPSCSSLHEVVAQALSTKQPKATHQPDQSAPPSPPCQAEAAAGTNGKQGQSASSTASDISSGRRRPLPLVNAATDDMGHVVATMNAWVLEEIGASLSALGPAKPSLPRKPSSRFRPKAPPQRYAERHPELAHTATVPPSIGVTSEDDDKGSSVNDDSDSDCVYDTYERVPASNLGGQYNPSDMGILVIDNEDDAEYFYWPEQDSDEDEEDEEDENAEAYYTADYPEEELDSDDEHGLGAYKYRNGNASDEEEYLGTQEDDDWGDHAEAEFAHEGELDDKEVIMARVRRFNRHFGVSK